MISPSRTFVVMATLLAIGSALQFTSPPDSSITIYTTLTESGSYTFPTDLVDDPTATYSIDVQGGLPSWLTFDSPSRTLTAATRTDNSQAIVVELTVTKDTDTINHSYDLITRRVYSEETSRQVGGSGTTIALASGGYFSAYSEHVGSAYTIYGQAYDDQGVAVADRLELFGPRYGFVQDVVQMPNEKIVVIWTHTSASNSDNELMTFRVIDASGASMGSPVVVPEGADGVNNPRLAPLANDDLMIVSEYAAVSGVNNYNTAVWVMSLTGTVVWSDTNINESSDNVADMRPFTTQLNDGSIAVCWLTGQTQIRWKRTSFGNGVYLTGDIQVTDGNARRHFPKIAGLQNGNLLIVWEEEAGSNRSVFGRIYSPDGTALTDAFKVSSNDQEKAEHSRVLAVGSSNTLVAWNVGNQVKSRLYNSNGIPISTIVDLHSGSLFQGKLSLLPDGNAVVVSTDGVASKINTQNGSVEITDRVFYPDITNTIENQAAITDKAWTFVIDGLNIVDYQSSAISTSADSLPAGILYESSTKTFSGTPTDAGVSNIEVTASNALGASVSTSFELSVCDPNEATVRYQGVYWLHNAAPTVDAQREGADRSDVTFTIPNPPSECVGDSSNIEAAHKQGDGYNNFGSQIIKDAANWEVKFDLTDSALLNSEICASSNSNGTVMYDCTIYFQGFYLDDFIMNWTYHLVLVLDNDSVIDLSVITDNSDLASDNVTLPLESAFVGDFDGNSRDGTEFSVGDDAFMKVSPPTDLVGNVEGTVQAVILTDMEESKDFHMDGLQETQVLTTGEVITRVPLIIETSQAKISLTVQWAIKDGNRRLLAEESKNLVTYSTLIDINIGSTPNNNNSEGDSSDSESDDNSTIIMVSVIAGAAVILVSLFVGYKIMINKKKQETGGMTPVASQECTQRV
mmetsp:Transcript_36023/g.40991  ORF Transcript_36023/g.40991 Transcript_36023/m.40991 type:complete len:912 (-) Transcript_36023:209-2944(-)|eukprot:CAMPEP_0115005698 /NCGR_PEP_ID=MMETSP0216-20121206/20041_1 /TAXON_ID=223996 /ORGANISM="Protocruzia adherens, Strain Boccale" /LENGTH=911 /DNA_ID=CAMNT_0002372103 /DNA_START=71 /DNA_END=2806 /DNA_ORIENTATION=-